jgi:hypothetical protein
VGPDEVMTQPAGRTEHRDRSGVLSFRVVVLSGFVYPKRKGAAPYVVLFLNNLLEVIAVSDCICRGGFSRPRFRILIVNTLQSIAGYRRWRVQLQFQDFA